jgi:hypothetical protein
MMSPCAKPLLTIRSEVPYDTLLYGWLHIHQLDLNRFVERSRQYERPYLAWETVRKVRNPFFTEGTGFEGYYIGQNYSSEELLDCLLQIGHHMLRSNGRLYRFNFRFQSRLMKTLLGDRSDPEAITVWSDQFGAALGRLRCHLLTCAVASHFNTETYRHTSSLPSIRYTPNHHTITQEYRIAPTGRGTMPKSTLNLESLKPSDFDAGQVVWSIGKFGHPLVREYLRERSLPLDERNVGSWA